jgi:hypothetical protein
MIRDILIREQSIDLNNIGTNGKIMTSNKNKRNISVTKYTLL